MAAFSDDDLFLRGAEDLDRIMGGCFPKPRPVIELAPPEWLENLRIVGVPPHFLAQANPDAYHILVPRLEGENVAAAMAFDHNGDCGIYSLGTLEHAGRRGLGTALTTLHLRNAVERGCQTASLQPTPMAEHIYTAVGFRDLGRIFEYVPPPGRPHNLDSLA